MTETRFPISPLSLNQLTRDLWGHYDAYAIAQLAPLEGDARYQPKFYKAPDLATERFAPYAYVDFGVEITPGSLICGVCLPAVPGSIRANPIAFPRTFSLQITDASIKDAKGKPFKFWDEPIPAAFVSNYCATFLDVNRGIVGSSISLFNCPHPVIGEGLFSVEIWETSGVAQRIEVVLAVLEAVKR